MAAVREEQRRVGERAEHFYSRLGAALSLWGSERGEKAVGFLRDLVFFFKKIVCFSMF